MRVPLGAVGQKRRVKSNAIRGEGGRKRLKSMMRGAKGFLFYSLIYRRECLHLYIDKTVIIIN